MIFCDMDGVLCDFIRSALLVHERPDALDAWPAGEWDIAKVLGITTDALWQRIDADGVGFWAELVRYEWANELVKLLEESDEVVIATSPSQAHYSAAGKVVWLQKHFGGRFGHPRRFMMGARKELLAHPRAILVDDSATNVKAFIDAGGEAILFPQPWNHLGSYHPTAESKLAHVRIELDRIAERKSFKNGSGKR